MYMFADELQVMVPDLKTFTTSLTENAQLGQSGERQKWETIDRGRAAP